MRNTNSPSVRPRISFDLLREVVAHIVHGQNDPFDSQCGICRLAHLADSEHQLRKAFERKKLGLQRHQNRICGDKRVDGQQAERGRAINQDEVETEGVDCGLAQRIVQQIAALFVGNQLHISR